MKVSLVKESDRIVKFRIEDKNICIQIRTFLSSHFYQELYIWLGRIKYNWLPAKIFIDEAGYGVILTIKQTENQNTEFNVEFWGHRNKPQKYLNSNMNSQELVTAFCNGIIQLIAEESYNFNSVLMSCINSLNWRSLKTPNQPISPNWNKHLAMYYASKNMTKNSYFINKYYPELKYVFDNLTIEEKWLIELHKILCLSSLASYREREKALVNLYRNLPIEIALGEIDNEWYQTQKEKINIEYEKYRANNPSSETRKERSLSQQDLRLKTLKIGQLVDGTVKLVRSYGVLIDIGGIVVLLHLDNISQIPIVHPQEVFYVGDWVRAIIVWMDMDKRRVLISTSDLEVEPGDILKNPLQVYETAEKMAKRYHDLVIEKTK